MPSSHSTDGTVDVDPEDEWRSPGGPPPGAWQQPAPPWPSAPPAAPPRRRFRWGLALGLAVVLGLLQILASPVTVFFVGAAFPVGAIVGTVVALACLRLGRDSPTADAVGFGILLSPLIGLTPITIAIITSS